VQPGTDQPTPARKGRGQHLFLYDGVCGLCNRVNRFLLRRDAGGRFDFASLQSPTGRAILKELGRNPDELNTFYVVKDYQSPSRVLLSKARGALFVLDSMGGIWRGLAAAGILPTPLLDFFYDLVARYRYRIFGRYESCPLPTAEHRQRFIDV
jgi:predicted DCC family thiol-disulfide oxidoreductase YuxK